jgi:hypothetical protein
MNGVPAKHDTLGRDAESFVAISAFFAANWSDKRKRQHCVFQHAFSARNSLLKSVTSFTLKS